MVVRTEHNITAASVIRSQAFLRAKDGLRPTLTQCNMQRSWRVLLQSHTSPEGRHVKIYIQRYIHVAKGDLAVQRFSPSKRVDSDSVHGSCEITRNLFILKDQRQRLEQNRAEQKLFLVTRLVYIEKANLTILLCKQPTPL